MYVTTATKLKKLGRRDKVENERSERGAEMRMDGVEERGRKVCNSGNCNPFHHPSDIVSVNTDCD